MGNENTNRAAGLAPDRFPKLSTLRLTPFSVALAGAGSIAALTSGSLSAQPVPPLQNDSFSVTANHSLTGVNVLANDPKINGLFVCGFTQPHFGSANVSSNGSLSYIPHNGFSGPDKFTYQGCVLGSSINNLSAQIFITVRPWAVDDSFAILNGAPISGNVLMNDVGSGLSVTGFSLPQHGSLQGGVGANGTFTYVPSTGFTSTDSFEYTVQDTFGSNASATVNLISPQPIPTLTVTMLGGLSALLGWVGWRRRG